ncbi:MAG: hypothetical protein IE931_08660 [Sphingobacteriales bacterium]|nr:hypothetical protein [Sphingobacteriales bacterium]
MKTVRMTILLLFVFVGITKAQYLQDVQGRPVMEKSYTDIAGTPLLFAHWIPGDVKLDNGSSYQNIPLKYNLVDDILYFMNPKDSTMLEFVQPVKSFTLKTLTGDLNYANGFPAVDGFKASSFYQILYDGKTKLLKKATKTVLENRPYNSATVERTFLDTVEYFTLQDGKTIKIRPSKKVLLELFGEKSNPMGDYLKKEKIDFKNDDDLIKVFKYYDSL